jgi:hypothetical protein
MRARKNPAAPLMRGGIRFSVRKMRQCKKARAVALSLHGNRRACRGGRAFLPGDAASI